MAPLIELGDIAAALRLGERSHVALVGGGGKSSVMLALGRSLPGRVVLTTTVKMGADQHGGHRVLIDPADDPADDPVDEPADQPADEQADDAVVAAAETGPVVVWSRIEGQKAIGIDPARCDRLAARVDHVVVEADGSRRQPFKAPAPYEPVVPASATVVPGLIGIDAIGKVIADRCHRPMRVAALAGSAPYERLSVAGAARVLAHERGQRASVPPGARYEVVVTKVSPSQTAVFGDLAERLTDAGIPVIGVRQADESALSALRYV